MTFEPLPVAGPTVLTARRDPAPATARDREIWIASMVALVLHLAFLAAFLRAPPVRLGEAGGQAEALNVEIVTAAELDGATGQDAPAQAAPPPATASPAAAATPPPAPQAQPAPERAEATPPPPAEPVSPAAEAEPAPSEAAKTVTPPPPPALMDEPDLLALPDQPPKPAEKAVKPAQAKPKPAAPPPRAKTAALDLSPPASAFKDAAATSYAANVTRPPGITRSGWNDDFGRGVIRALRETMPPHPGQNRELTIYFVLSSNGDIVEVKVVRGSTDATLDQNVAFAARQSNFPIPPVGATAIDRTFRVTYIYR